MGSATELQMQQTACQDLLTKAGTHSGCLRGKTIFHKWGDSVDEKTNKGFAQKITSVISWQRLYVIVHDGYFIIYKSETSKKPARIIDLAGFQSVEKEEYLKIKDVPWPFKICSDLNNKVMYYGATSEPELKKWIEAVTKGIHDAKESGRKPVIVEKKEITPKPKTKRDKPLPKVPSIHPSPSDVYEDDDDEDLQDDYDYIPDPIEEMHQNSKPSPAPRSQLPSLPGEPSSSSGTGREVEYEMHAPRGIHPPVEKAVSAVKPVQRKDLAVPPAPVENIASAKVNLKKNPPAVPSQTVRPLPPVAKKPPAVPTNLAKKTIPEIPVEKNSVGENEYDDDVEYELTNDKLLADATWKGSSEESTELMKKMTEEGVFMVRPSTTGNGDLTLQVLSDQAVRKYKIGKEGKQFRMAGGETFDSMAELLIFYQKNSIPNHSTKLTKPFSKV